MTAPAAEQIDSKIPAATDSPRTAAPLRGAVPARLPFADEQMTRSGGRWRLLGYALGILGLAALGLLGWRRFGDHIPRPAWLGGAATSAKLESASYYTVARGDLRVVLTETGLLRALKSHAVSPKIERQQLTITWLADEGASVKTGDVVARFDPKPFEDQLRTIQGELETSRRQQEVAVAAVEIEVSNGKSMIAEAETAVEDAHVKLRTYIDLEAPKRLNEVDAQINELRQKVEEATKTAAQAKAQLDDGIFNDESQRRQFEQQYKGAQENLRTLAKQHEAAKLARKIFRTYEYPQTLANRKQEVANAELDLAKARIGAENGLNQKRAELAQVNERISRHQRDEARLKGWIEACDLRAPVNGLVVYGDGRNYYGPGGLQVGGMWYGGNPLMTIPDLSAFEIDVAIAEQYRGLINAGIPVTIRIQALADQRFTGKVKDISRMGRPRSPYDPTGPRAYQTVISVDSASDKLVSGMSAEVEILADEVRDVLLVPIDAVYNDGGTSVVFLKSALGVRKHPVEVGRRNLHVVEVIGGLAEGDMVSVAPSSELLELLKPGGPADEPAQDEAAGSPAPGQPPPQAPPAGASMTPPPSGTR